MKKRIKELEELIERLKDDMFKKCGIPKSRLSTCKTWKDCTNPHYDCINCPLRYPINNVNDFSNENRYKLCSLAKCKMTERDNCYGCPYQGYSENDGRIAIISTNGSVNILI